MNFVLRKFEERDIPSIAKYANNEKVAANLRNVFPYPYTENDAREYILACMQNDETRQCVRAIDVDGEAVGSIGIFQGNDVYEKSAELGYWLGEPFWGKGIVSNAARELCAYAFAHYDIVRVYAEPYAYNNGSRRVLEKAGFTLEGVKRCSVYKNGKVLDSCVYALLEQGLGE